MMTKIIVKILPLYMFIFRFLTIILFVHKPLIRGSFSQKHYYISCFFINKRQYLKPNVNLHPDKRKL